MISKHNQIHTQVQKNMKSQHPVPLKSVRTRTLERRQTAERRGPHESEESPTALTVWTHRQTSAKRNNQR